MKVGNQSELKFAMLVRDFRDPYPLRPEGSYWTNFNECITITVL